MFKGPFWGALRCLLDGTLLYVSKPWIWTIPVLLLVSLPLFPTRSHVCLPVCQMRLPELGKGRGLLREEVEWPLRETKAMPSLARPLKPKGSGVQLQTLGCGEWNPL